MGPVHPWRAHRTALIGPQTTNWRLDAINKMSIIGGMTTSARTLADHLGQGAMAQRMGVTLAAVNKAVMRGALPASWFPAIRGMCLDAGIECPEEAFNFKPSALDAATEAAE